jgi:hypothetical protein
MTKNFGWVDKVVSSAAFVTAKLCLIDTGSKRQYQLSQSVSYCICHAALPRHTLRC